MTNKSIFHISKMDCLSEEQLIKMKLDSLNEIKSLGFYIPNRQLTAYHTGQVQPILAALESLNLNTKLISTELSEMTLEI